LFSELNDAAEEKRRFEQQAAEIARGDQKARPTMRSTSTRSNREWPPTGGLGLGIDRLLLSGASSAPRGPAVPGDEELVRPGGDAFVDFGAGRSFA